MNIINRINTQAKILREVAFVTYKEWAAYRTHSMVSIFVGPVYFIVQYFIWKAVYSGNAGSTIYGMDFSSMVRYYGAVTLLGYLTMDFADWNLNMLVKSGKYLTFALRPLNHRFFALSQKVGHRILGFTIEFIPCLLIFIFIFKVNMTPGFPLWTLVSVVLAFLMQFYFNYFLGLLSFFLTDTQGIRWAFNFLAQFFSGTIIPLVFLPSWMQKIQFFLPFQYISYVPVRVFTGSYELNGIDFSIPQTVGIQAVAVLAVFLLNITTGKMAMRRFTAAGA